jgi:SAM-dependent methyltransferase
MSMSDLGNGKGIAPENDIGNNVRYYKRDFWIEQGSRNYSQPHYRLEKSARIISKLARGRACSLLDVGCGPATLMRLLPSNIQYYGIDMAIPDPAPNLIEADILETPIRFGDQRFDIISVQGVFEYVGDFQPQKLAEIAQLLNRNGTVILSYVNFGHRHPKICKPYSNVQPIGDFRQSLMNYFKIDRSIPTSHNWGHWEPGLKGLRAVNMHMNVNIPFISPILAVEYFFLCSLRDS